MIGLELGMSVASAALRNEPTGAPTGSRSDVVATAKRALKAGEMLDGEGGFCVWGKRGGRALARRGSTAARACARRQAQARCRGGPMPTWAMSITTKDFAVKVRREMEGRRPAD